MPSGSPSDQDDESLSIFLTPDAAGPSPVRGAMPPPAARRIAVFRSLRRHWFIAFVLLALTGASAVPVVQVLRTPIYASEATILVSQTFARNLSEDQELQLPRFSEFIKQQIVTIQREEIAMDALERLGERRSLWMQPGESRRDAAGRLSRSLLARQVPETAYVTVGLEGRSPEGLAEIVNAVVEAFLARSRGQPFYEMDLRLEVLNRHKAQLVEEIRAKTELLARWAKEHSVPGFDAKLTENPVADADRIRQAARAKRMELEARVAALDARQQATRSTDLAAEAKDLAASDAEFMGLRTTLLTKKNDYRAKITGLTADHEGRKSIEKQISDIDAEIERAEKGAVARQQQVLLQRRDLRLKEERMALLTELEQATRHEKALTDDVTDAARKAQRFNDVYFEAQSVQQEVERLRRQLSAIEDRIDMMRLESFAPGFIHLAAAAMPPTLPQPVKLGKWLGMIGLCGVFLVFGVPVLIDSLDNRVKTPADLVREVDGSILLGIPEREPETEPFIRDQLRRMALGLDRERRQRNRRRIVFTGVKSGAGTTQIVLELTRELRHLGVHAIAMEANALKPDPRFAGSNGHAGLISVLAGKASIEQTVIPPDRSLPLRIPVGETGGRSILVGVNNLAQVFNDIMGHLEIVLIDAPPLLLSSDAEMLAGMADAVVLIVGAYDTKMPDVRRAFRILRQVGTPVLQTVVSRVRVEDGGRGRDYADLIKEYNVVTRSPQE